MKQAIPAPAFRHLILKKLKNYEDGLKLVKSLEDVTYICGGYETVNKQGRQDLHAHFLIYSKYDRRITNQRKTFKNPLRMPICDETDSTSYPVEILPKLISYILKNGDPYDYNDNQQYYNIPNYTELIEQAVAEHSKHTDAETGKAKTATQKLLEYFDNNKDMFIELDGQPKGFSKYKRIIHDHCCKYAKDNWKLIDANTILKMTSTVLLHLEFTSSKFVNKCWEINESKL